MINKEEQNKGSEDTEKALETEVSSNDIFKEFGIRISQVKIDEIISVADKLFSITGKMATNLDVRNELGQGSMSYISPVLKAWREQKKQKVVGVEIPAVPVFLFDSVKPLIDNLWRAAYLEIKKDDQALIDDYKNQLKEFKQDWLDSLNEISGLEIAIEKMGADQKELKENHQIESEKLKLEISTKEEIIENHRVEKQGLEVEIKVQKALIERLEDEIKKQEKTIDRLFTQAKSTK